MYWNILGGSEDLEKELISNSSGDSRSDIKAQFNIPILALPEGDIKGNQNTRICVIPPTPLPPNYDPYDNYYLT